jgi:hypothetical protein
MLYAPLVRLTTLMGYVGGDHADHLLQDIEHFPWIIERGGRLGDLKCEAVQRRLMVDLVAMSRDERSTKLLEHTAMECRVSGVLMERSRVVEMTFAVSTMWDLGSRFDLDPVLHVARRYMSCIPQTKRHEG